MELFSEIYNCYYIVVSKIIDESIDGKISKEIVNNIIKKFAFEESSLFIMPKIETGAWSFFDDKMDCKIKNKSKFTLTKIQKMWLCSVFNDERISLFLEDDEIIKAKTYFKDNNIEPLFLQDDFYYFDQFSLGDNYLDKNYISHFKKLIRAIKSREVLTISYSAKKGKLITGDFLVFKMEYSKKNNRHRVYTLNIKNGRDRDFQLFNVSRIITISESENEYNKNISFEKHIENNFIKEPVILEISNERNALERCMVQFANFNKRTEYNEETKKYICYIYYSEDLEKELLIQVLSFIPLVKVLGNDKFLKQVMERVNMQKNLMSLNEHL